MPDSPHSENPTFDEVPTFYRNRIVVEPVKDISVSVGNPEGSASDLSTDFLALKKGTGALASLALAGYTSILTMEGFHEGNPTKMMTSALFAGLASFGAIRAITPKTHE